MLLDIILREGVRYIITSQENSGLVELMNFDNYLFLTERRRLSAVRIKLQFFI